MHATARIHSVFHVSQLKKHVRVATTATELPPTDDDGLIHNEPVARYTGSKNGEKRQCCSNRGFGSMQKYIP